MNHRKLEIDEAALAINQHLYGTLKLKKWSTLLASALANKDTIYLLLVLDHGSRFNDKSKQIVCDLLNVKRTYTAVGMRKIIANHCGISIEEIEKSIRLRRNEEALIRAQNAVKSKYQNADDVFSLYRSYINKGYDKLEKIGRKYWLINNDFRGFEIKNKVIKEYIEIELMLSDHTL